MRRKPHKQPSSALRRRQQQLLRQLPPLDRLLRGSLIERYKPCGKPGCKCAHGPGHGPKYYLSTSYPGRRPQMDYVPQDFRRQVTEALDAGAGMVLLDNMSPDTVRACVHLARERRGNVLVEVSGGVTLDTVAAYAAAGADLISSSAITQSAPALDLGLDLLPERRAAGRPPSATDDLGDG